MPEVIETLVYTFDELDECARECARDWYRLTLPHENWCDFVFEDFERVCEILGVELATHSVRLHGGGILHEPRIWFSEFASQGDGACFEGRYSYRKGAARNIRAYAPKDQQLVAIADELQHIQRQNLYALEARIAHRGRYFHEHSMEISVKRASQTWQSPTNGAEEILCEALRDLARWLYRELEREHDFQMSSEIIDEALRGNGYTFTKEGKRFG